MSQRWAAPELTPPPRGGGRRKAAALGVLMSQRWAAPELTPPPRGGSRRKAALGVLSGGVDKMIYVANLVARMRASASQTHAVGAQVDRS